MYGFGQQKNIYAGQAENNICRASVKENMDGAGRKKYMDLKLG